MLAISGGAMRGIASAGVIHGLLNSGRLDRSKIKLITGDSFGALLATLYGLGWHPNAVRRLLLEAPLKRLFSPLLPWAWRKTTMAINPISLEPFGNWLHEQLSTEIMSAGYGITPTLINYWDSASDREILFHGYIGRAYKDYCLAVIRSMALPGLRADHCRYLDGGIASHPPLPADTEEKIVHIDLGFAGLVEREGDTIPKGAFEINRALYCYEVTASKAQEGRFAGFKHVERWNPKVYDVDSLDLCMNYNDRVDLYYRGYDYGLTGEPVVLTSAS